MLRSSPLLFLPCHLIGKRSFGSIQNVLLSPLALVPSYLTVLRPFTVSFPTLRHVPPLFLAVWVQSAQAFSTSPVRKKLYTVRWFAICTGISMYMCCCSISTVVVCVARFMMTRSEEHTSELQSL